MAGYDNIKNKGFDSRSPEERKEIAKLGGIASGKARRRKANFRKTLNLLLTSEIDNEEYRPMLEALGVDCTLESAMLMAQIMEAVHGNTKAAYFVAQYAGQSDLSEHAEEIERRTANADIALKEARKADITGENENDDALKKLDEILKGLRDNAVKQETE